LRKDVDFATRNAKANFMRHFADQRFSTDLEDLKKSSGESVLWLLVLAKDGYLTYVSSHFSSALGCNKLFADSDIMQNVMKYK